MNFIILFCLFQEIYITYCSSFMKYEPGDIAPSFSVQTLDGRLVYKEKSRNDSTPSNPVIFCAFTNHSSFLQALWTEENSVRSLLEISPKETQFVFLSLDDQAKADVSFMRNNIFTEIEKLHAEKDRLDFFKEKQRRKMLQNITLFKRDVNEKRTKIKKDNIFKKMKGNLELLNNDHTGDADLVEWKKHFHFVSFPLFTFGNWIPYVMERWSCSGTVCGLPQIVFKNKKGDILNIVARLDARYDWQPMSSKTTKHKKRKLVYIENPCDGETIGKRERKKSHDVALVSSDGSCSIFEKIQNISMAYNIDEVIIYAKYNEPLYEIKCQKAECYQLLPGTTSMISYKAGMEAKNILVNLKKELYVSFQTTSQDNFFFAIDHQGRLEETGFFLYPSLRFLAYEAQWFHYKADILKHTGKHAKIVHVFNHTVMQGAQGAVQMIHLPRDYLTYRNVELDMSLKCPEKYDTSCPHWDHVIHLSVCCDDKRLCNSELARWITPYSRGIGRWITPITSLLPLFTSRTCNLTMRTVPWEMPWTPTLNIRFSDHRSDFKDGYSQKRNSPDLVPYKIIKLFEGGVFDKNYNGKYKPMTFFVKEKTRKVELVALITGHGRDNNGCAEFCVTSHHFLVNDQSENVRKFRNAATAMGCAQRVGEGVEPNEHGTWLYGRDGWCPGQQVVPWLVDITSQTTINQQNNITYFSYFNGLNPNPKHSPGNIDMSSYLVFYQLPRGK